MDKLPKGKSGETKPEPHEDEVHVPKVHVGTPETAIPAAMGFAVSVRRPELLATITYPLPEDQQRGTVMMVGELMKTVFDLEKRLRSVSGKADKAKMEVVALRDQIELIVQRVEFALTAVSSVQKSAEPNDEE